MRRARLLRQGDDVPVALEEQWMDDIRIVRPILTRHFGDALRIATSSGAPLRSEIAEYLDACGVTVLGSYGRMEHLCIAFNRPEKYRHDSVGVAMPGTSLAVAHDGEILVRRGDLTFAGYHRRALESQEAFTEDGVWFRTGDIGGIDSQGFVRIATRNRALGTSPGRASDSPLTPDR
jgi:long-chain acyl-CoA synthetase